MAKVRARPETDTLYLDFFFQGKRCREQTSLVDSTGNRRRLQAVLDRLTKEIKAGTFDYACYFPNSRNAAHFPGYQTGAFSQRGGVIAGQDHLELLSKIAAAHREAGARYGGKT